MTFEPTQEQTNFINHGGTAFVEACPGAGKTRCVVERAKRYLANTDTNKALAFLSFTHSAIEEIQSRLVADSVLPHPHFPHFTGTFDSFIWIFLVAPFGHESAQNSLSILPDKNLIEVRPFPSAQPLPLGLFNQQTGKIIPELASRAGFNRDGKSWETSAKRIRETLLKNGYVDFEDVRRIAKANLSDQTFSKRIAKIFAARFGEIIIDEAQDCNPDDLELIEWLRLQAKIPLKLVCDLNQSIYSFRGGITDELVAYANHFSSGQRLTLSGNFRSTENICKATHHLRPPESQGLVDQALGSSKDLDVPVYVLSYSGKVSAEISNRFESLLSEHTIEPSEAPLIAKVRATGLNATGRQSFANERRIIQLAIAVTNFNQSSSSKVRLEALKKAHEILLFVSGELADEGYEHTILELEIDPLKWRGEAMAMLRQLNFSEEEGDTRPGWVERVRTYLKPYFKISGTLGQKFPNRAELDPILLSKPVSKIVSHTIHEVKGREFPAVCVVMTSQTSKGILDCLDGTNNGKIEAAREIYVAASRAEKLLVFACIKSQASRLQKRLASSGANVELCLSN